VDIKITRCVQEIRVYPLRARNQIISFAQEISFAHTPMSFRLRGKFFTCCFSLERVHTTSNRNFYYNLRRPQSMLSVKIIPVPRQIHSLEYDLSHAGNCLRLNSLQMPSLFAHKCTTKVMNTDMFN
jgi:hypothetical protein